MSLPGSFWKIGLFIIVFSAEYLVVAEARGEDVWGEEFWNPKPMEDDLILPTRCGGAIAFRPVEVPTIDNWLEDQFVDLGSGDGDINYEEYFNSVGIAGSFAPEGNTSGRLFYMGKYEVTTAQYKAVIGEPCPEPESLDWMDQLPVEKVSWFDAVDFTRQLTEWVIREANEKMPKEAELFGFVRLPTEAEWEFSARGGSSVPPEQFGRRLFPMDGNLSQYAWYRGECGEGTQLIGGKKPNPLGLFDMLGNVQEYVFDFYRLNRIGRFHGANGAGIAKGGSCRTSEQRLRSAARKEVFLFNPQSGEAAELGYTGFRVLIAAPITVSNARLEELNEDWEELRQIQTGQPGDANPIAKLEAIANEQTEIGLQTTLQQIASVLSEEILERNDQQRDAARMGILACSQLARNYRLRERQRSRFQGGLDACVRDDGTKCDTYDAYVSSVEQAERGMELTAAVYVDIVKELSQSYHDVLLADTLDIVVEQYRNIDTGITTDLAGLCVKQISENRSSPRSNFDVFLEEIIAFVP